MSFVSEVIKNMGLGKKLIRLHTGCLQTNMTINVIGRF